mgnify:CR=1 FL=1
MKAVLRLPFRACRSSSRRTAASARSASTAARSSGRSPHGDTPDNVRNHAALKGVTIPRTGQAGIIGTLVTRTLLIAGEATETTAGHPAGALLRAYDKATRQGCGRGPDAGAPDRVADDLHAQRPSIHRRRGRWRRPSGRDWWRSGCRQRRRRTSLADGAGIGDSGSGIGSDRGSRTGLILIPDP